MTSELKVSRIANPSDTSLPVEFAQYPVHAGLPIGTVLYSAGVLRAYPIRILRLLGGYTLTENAPGDYTLNLQGGSNGDRYTITSIVTLASGLPNFHVVADSDHNVIYEIDALRAYVTGGVFTINIFNDSITNVRVGTSIIYTQLNTGQIHFVPGTGVTLRNPTPNPYSRTQFSKVSLIKVAANTWELAGDLGPLTS